MTGFFNDDYIEDVNFKRGKRYRCDDCDYIWALESKVDATDEMEQDASFYDEDEIPCPMCGSLNVAEY